MRTLKLLFDQGTPAPWRERFPAHSADTLAEKGRSDKDNGELLDVTQREGYEVLVTTDQSLAHHQNLAGRESALSFCFHRLARCSPSHKGNRQAIAAVGAREVNEVPIRVK